MSRPLTFPLDQIMLGETEDRRPGYQILIYDVRSTVDTIRDIVLGNALQALTGPLDITPFVERAKIDEQAGSYVSGGVASTTVGLTVIDAEGTFDPLLTRTDPTIDGRYFRSGNVIRIIEGDNQVLSADWKTTFTGELIGQAGYDRNRTTGASVLTTKALSREAAYLHTKRTSEEFVIGSTYLEAIESVAQNEMGLDVAELDFPAGFGAALIPHKVVQLVDENPITMLARLMFIDQLIPRFTGEGKLSAIQDRATGSPTRIYLGRNHITSIVRPFSDLTPPSKVCVIGLDANLSKVSMPNQVLATLEITTGYFTPPEKIKTYWRDDKTLMADNVRLKVFVSINGGIIPLDPVAAQIGTGSETITLIQSGDPDQIGTVGATLTAKTGFAPWLIVFLLTIYVGLSAIPDSWVGFGSGSTIPIGRVIAGVALAAAMIIMAKLGRGSYAFTGDPFEYVFKEIRRCAKVSGSPVFTDTEVTLENHLVSTIAQADQAAFQSLFRLQANKHPRTITMIHDVGLEPNDIIEFQDTTERYLIVSIGRTLTRDPVQASSTVEALDVTSDVSVGT